MSQDEARRSAIAKAGRRLLPFLCLCYAVNFLDRVNVGFAALAMNDDLGFSPSVFGVGAGIFFAGYILFEVPSNLAMQKFGARIWIARIMISWGLVAIAMAFVSGERSFYALRFLLGVAEAGFFPGIILYLTYWFPARERARIVALFMAAVPLATMVGGPVSGALLEMHGLLGLKGWHWLFIVEGLPAVILGVIALKFLDDRPEHARWLSQDERTTLASTLAAEAKATRETGYAELGQALTRPRVLVLGFLYFCIVIGFYGVSFWMPQVIQTYGQTPLRIGFLTAIPFFFAAVAMVAWGAHSDRTGERIWHVALPLLAAGLAFAWSATTLPLWLIMVALTLATAGDLCRDRHILVAADLDPDGHGRGGGTRADQLARQCGRLGRAADHRRDQAGDRLVHRGTAVPRRRARARRGGGAAVRLCRSVRAPPRRMP